VSVRRATTVAVLAIAVCIAHVLLVRAMAHGHVAHVLLGSGNAPPPIGAAVLAMALVVVRFGAVVVSPGALLASAASLVAHAVVGPPRAGGAPVSERQRDGASDGDGAADGDDGSGTRSGTGTKPGGSGSSSAVALAAGRGISIEGRATQ
jgi:uncharacterized membrane protein YgcG